MIDRVGAGGQLPGPCSLLGGVEMKKQTPQEVLLTAADLLQFERGWCRGLLEDRDGHLCAMGALNMATWGRYIYPPSLRAPWWGEAVKALGRILGFDTERVPVFDTTMGSDTTLNTIVEWNNKVARDGDEVADAMRKAAKYLDNKGE